MSTVFAQSKTHKVKKSKSVKTAVAVTPKMEVTSNQSQPTSDEIKAREAAAAQGTDQASTPVAIGKAPVEFTETKHSFGKIKQGVPASYYFTFVNKSSTPVIIESATAGCGCTTPEYPKGPVAKGSSEKIKVTYNAASMGNFTKQVTVKVAKYTEPIVLTIEGEVTAAPAADPKEK